MALTQISTAGVKDDAVTSGKIPANAVGSSELADNAVDTAAIANNAVTTAKINDQAVTLAKLPHGTSSNDGKFLRANNGADPTFETVTSTTINNNADNRVITGSGTANTLNGESGLTFSGSVLTNTNTSANPQIKLISAADGMSEFHFGDANDATRANILYRSGSSGDALCFNGYNNTERMRIDSSGRLLINGTDANTVHTNADDVIIGKTSNSVTGLSIVTSTSGYGTLQFSDGGGNKNQGQVAYNHSNNTMNFTTGESTRMSIVNDIVKVNDGDIVIGTSGRGINFDTAGSGSDQLLDDYEEGTFSATIHSGGTVSSFTNNRCSYTKIGRFVYYQIYLQMSGTGNSSHFQIGNLPFTSSTYTLGYGGANIHYQNNVFQNSGDTIIYHVQNTNRLAFYRNSGNQVTGNSGAIFGNRDFIINGYFVIA